MQAQRVFIGVAWPYVNGDIHPGHIAGNFLPADIFARYLRQQGKEVLMVSGSDCYGTPITLEADKRHKTNAQIVAEYHPHHLELFQAFNIKFDHYTQTTNAVHQEVVAQMVIDLAKRGYLFKESTEQFFDPEKSRFLPDRYVEGECQFCGFKEARGDQCDQCGRVLDTADLKNPHNKLTGAKVILKSSEHLFLDWSKLQPFLEEYVASHQSEWRNWVYQEALGWLKKGLRPRAITRDIDWGVVIPNDQLPPKLQLAEANQKRIYVWFEAVIGYLSAAKEFGKDWRAYWFPESPSEVAMYNFMGKDNVVFHALFWPGQLYGAFGDQVKLPDVIAANQYLNLEGRKFSKSRGITLDSLYLAREYGADPLRFYLTYIMPENHDADFSWADFASFNNTVLINVFGNFLNRVLKLSEKMDYLQTKALADSEVIDAISTAVTNINNHLDNCQFKLYVQSLLEIARYGNEYIARNEPWKLAATDPERFDQVMVGAMRLVLSLLDLMTPLIPETTVKLKAQLGLPEGDNYRLQQVKVQKAEPLFSRIDPEKVAAEQAKLNQ